MTDEAEYLARLKREADIAQGGGGAEAFGEAIEDEQIGQLQVTPRLSRVMSSPGA
jgi:hypothetical protein